MRSSALVPVSRRGFLKMLGAGGAGLVLGCGADPSFPDGGDPLAGPWIWVKIGSDTAEGRGDVTLVIPRAELGQGTMTGLAMLLADELDLDWARIRTEWAPPLVEYGHVATSSSNAMRNLWQPLRRTGAMARALLVAAAAERWGVDPAGCRTQRGQILHPASGERLSYGRLATRAAELPLPEGVRLKRREDFVFIGRSMPRLDIPAKLDGSALFGIDVEVPGMLVATLAHCPVDEARLTGWNSAAAQAVSGVRHVVALNDPGDRGRPAVAVVADGYWSARKGADALALSWDGGEGWNGDRIEASLRELMEKPGESPVSRGDAAKALEAASRIVTASYTTPALAHATMEPMNCTASLEGGRCHVWVPTQKPGDVRSRAAKASGLREEDVVVHCTYAGGGFGRRMWNDFVSQAVQIAKAVEAPVKLIWSREEDMRNDFYRPATLHHLRAGLDDRGHPDAWHHRLAGRGSIAGIGIGLAHPPYAIPNKQVDVMRRRRAIPRDGLWRSVAWSQNSFATECFLDEVARAGGHDPVRLRAHLLRHAPRQRAVLELAAGEAGWGEPLTVGHHLGVALAEMGGSVCAQVAEISLTEGGGIRVHRIVCAADCGLLVNPDAVVAQLEGGTLFGLSAALHGEITLRDGRVEQGNFDDYLILRMSESPDVEVHVIEGSTAPTGAGEIAVPGAAPAVANAVYAATGRPIRSLPIRPEHG
jgi:isoquinoline 1-oxidoreductase beta subunit